MRRNARYARFAAIAVFALCTGACATFATGETKLQTVKTVGIISAIGDQMTVARAGLTGPDDGARTVPIASWGLDDLIVQRATASLDGRFQVQAVTYNRAAFTKIENSVLTPVNLVRSDPIKRLIKSEVSPQGLDAYIVITKAKANIGAGGRKVEGVGLITYGTVLETYSQIYALYEIRVIDGRTFDIIKKLAAPPLDNTGHVRLSGPSRLVDGDYSISAPDGARQGLREPIIDLIMKSLPTTLNDMHLGSL
jgi:hypothetical protein